MPLLHHYLGRDLRERARPQLSPEERAELEDAQLEFAKCLRREGVDVPDPQPDPMPFGGRLDRDDPRVREALDECRQILQDALPEGGRLRIGPGGAR